MRYRFGVKNKIITISLNHLLKCGPLKINCSLWWIIYGLDEWGQKQTRGCTRVIVIAMFQLYNCKFFYIYTYGFFLLSSIWVLVKSSDRIIDSAAATGRVKRFIFFFCFVFSCKVQKKPLAVKKKKGWPVRERKKYSCIFGNSFYVYREESGNHRFTVFPRVPEIHFL